MEKLRKIAEIIQLAGFYQLSRNHFNFYLFSAVILSLVGYLFLLSFPAVVLAGVLSFSTLIDNSLYEQSWVYISTFAVIVAASAYMTYLICKIKFEPPAGTELPWEKYPQLAELIDGAEKQAFGLRINSVRINNSLELQVQKTPVFGIPVWCKNTLILGFSGLQGIPPAHAGYLITRKLLQFGKRNVVTSWLARTEQVWTQYPNALINRRFSGEYLLFWFFKLYAPINTRASLYARQASELLADTDILDSINSGEYLYAMELELAVHEYIKKQYWPSILKMLKTGKVETGSIQPFARLPVALNQNFYGDKLRTCLHKIYASDEDRKSLMPSLKNRMKNIGYQKLKLPVMTKKNAAQHLFGNDYSRIVDYMDFQWTKIMNGVVSKTSKKTVTQRARLDAVA